MNKVTILSNEWKCKEMLCGMRLQIIYVSSQELWSQCTLQAPSSKLSLEMEVVIHQATATVSCELSNIPPYSLDHLARESQFLLVAI